MFPPIIKSNNYILRPYSVNDEERFIETALDKNSQEFMGGSSGNEFKERRLFKKIHTIYQKNEGKWFWIWGIYKNDILCGHLELKETDNTNQDELEIVYMIHPLERQKGVMTEVLFTLKKNQHKWNKQIIATVSPNNIKSISLLNKWGITKKEILLDNDTKKEYLKVFLVN